MTESDYRRLPGSDHLPLYDEDDSRCEQIERPNCIAYESLLEATELDDALACTCDPNLELRGGIRYEADGGVKFVYANFWKRQRNNGA